MTILRHGPSRLVSAATVRRVKVARVLSILQDDGWYLDRVRGSHRIYKHPSKPGTVTVAGKPRDEIRPKTLASMRKQAGLEELR